MMTGAIRTEGVEARKKGSGGRQAEGEGLRRGIWISGAPRLRENGAEKQEME
jgi:hypothetical protein